MKNQIFKTIINPDILWNFLIENGSMQDNHYIFSKDLYKKAVYKETIMTLIKTIEPYYHESKKHYITRKMDYAKFITIIRQLCNINNVKYSTKMIYNNSSYEIVYYIYKIVTTTDLSLNIIV